MSQRPEPWVVDPDDPRAPPEEIWAQLSHGQRAEILANLPSEFPPSEAHPPEGDHHTEAVYGARTTLRRFFGKTGRSIYVGTNLPVYYPGLVMFSPDVIAVLDVAAHARPSWVVSQEGKGLDLALEVVVLGHRRKDVTDNVERYAALGITEYFVFDRPRRRLQGYRLRESGRGYEPLLAQHGRLGSQVLGLELGVEGDSLRFYVGDAVLPGSDELISKLESFVDDLEERVNLAEQVAEDERARADREARRAEDESRRAEDQSRRAEATEARLREALAELERLRAIEKQ